MNFPEPKTRREKIMVSAWQVFAAYGFRRTSMQDIADATGISRPALYLEFANKADIFRALATSKFEMNIEQVKAVFDSKLMFEEKLLNTLIMSFADFYKTLEDTPHGEELLSVKTELAGDIYLNWLDDIKSVICDGINNERKKGGIEFGKSGLDAEEISAIIVNTMHGSKSRQTDENELRARAESVVKLVMSSILPRSS